MSSAPSASALSAVLRCRGSIRTRNSPSKQPLSAAHSLGTAGSPAERARSRTASAWQAISLRTRVMMAKMIKVVFESLQVGFRVPRNNQVSDPKLWQVEARRAAPAVPNARNLARTLRYGCLYTFSSLNPLSAFVFKLSARSLRVLKRAGKVPFSVLPGWAAWRSTCLSLTRLVAECMNMRCLVVPRRSNIRNLKAPPHLQSQLAANIKTGSLKVSVRDFHMQNTVLEFHMLWRYVLLSLFFLSFFFF